jgi:hypothetical protein
MHSSDDISFMFLPFSVYIMIEIFALSRQTNPALAIMSNTREYAASESIVSSQSKSSGGHP